MNVLTIKHEQNLEVSPQGQIRETRSVQVAIDYNALATGWLARFATTRRGRSALPVLLALGLHARPLQGEDLSQLEEMGLATQEDAGRLYARVTDVGLGEELGLDRKTVARAAVWLESQQLLRILELPKEYRDSHGQFAGNKAYIMLADDMISTVGTEHPPSESTVGPQRPPSESTVGTERPRSEPTVDTQHPPSEPTVGTEHPRSEPAVGAQRPRSEPTVGPQRPPSAVSVGVQHPHRGPSVPTKKEEEEKEQKQMVVGDVFSSFARLAGHPAAYQPSAEDQRLLDQLLAEGYTFEQIIRGIQSAVQQHRRRQQGGRVQRFAFCVPVIRALGRPSGPADAAALGTAPTVTEGSDGAQKDVRAVVERWYAEEIGQLTPMTRAEIGRLVGQYPDLARWEAGFRASVGINTPLGRWRYIQTVVAQANAPAADLSSGAEGENRRGPTREGETPEGDGHAPDLPDGVQADLDRLGWAGPCDEIAAAFQEDPALVRAWLEHWLERTRPGFNAAGAFLKSLRTGRRPIRSPRQEQVYGVSLADNDDETEPEEKQESEDPETSWARECWRRVLDELALQMTRETFNTWLKQARVVAYEDGMLWVAVETEYIKDWVTSRLMLPIKRTVTGVFGEGIEIRFVTPEEVVAG